MKLCSHIVLANEVFISVFELLSYINHQHSFFIVTISTSTWKIWSTLSSTFIKNYNSLILSFNILEYKHSILEQKIQAVLNTTHTTWLDLLHSFENEHIDNILQVTLVSWHLQGVYWFPNVLITQQVSVFIKETIDYNIVISKHYSSNLTIWWYSYSSQWLHIRLAVNNDWNKLWCHLCSGIILKLFVFCPNCTTSQTTLNVIYSKINNQIKMEIIRQNNRVIEIKTYMIQK